MEKELQTQDLKERIAKLEELVKDLEEVITTIATYNDDYRCIQTKEDFYQVSEFGCDVRSIYRRVT